jgi:hypothetical protein
MTKDSGFANRPSLRQKTVMFRAHASCAECPLQDAEGTCHHPEAAEDVAAPCAVKFYERKAHPSCPLRKNDLQIGLR